ncbi:MAG: glycosyl hydrolase [Crocinitomicaceae bacterium]|tara:strand:+ start:45140 stop:48355 length:3216 start_codon:yes stop_codon:yes gene_type:complete
MKYIILLFAALSYTAYAQEKHTIDAGTVSAVSFRMVGPALTSGRVSDLAIHPSNTNTWYVSTASGGLWKTKNHGITFSPIFDSYDSYSLGCVEIAPTNKNTVWVGTGENNNQRSVSYGDGVYKSLNGGETFENMGLKNSEHIGSIVIDPNNENIIWVAAYGPLWSSGGDRGVYKSIDGGKTWNRTLFVSENTGIAEVHMDPSNPNVLYASAHQRRRREWTFISGGPESGVYKSIDGGETWKEINKGLPEGYMGRVGLAISPVDSDIVYAIVEARYGKKGFYKSVNKGENWSKQSDYATSGNYYQEIFCDPKDVDKVFSMNTYLHHTEDGGKTFKRTGEKKKHVDNHCIWIDPSDTDHWVVGCDGGVYETYTHAKEWRYFSNIPIIQFYKVTTDNDAPFYNIYGGTQDNNSMGGPSSTGNAAGILNSDWFITNGGDGFESATDWSNPNITYAQAQYGWLVRYDKASGEKVPIQPMPGENEAAYRWNWDAPLLVSRHDASTVYFAANKLFKSTNRGDDWTTISTDLSRQLDRNKLSVMGQVWSMDAVMKNKSTTIYGNIVALDESPLKQGLLYAGTDDGLIQVTDDDGKTWREIDNIKGAPEQTKVNMVTASLHDVNEVFVAFNSQRSGDFTPYLFHSNDQGKTWVSIASNLPERGNVYCIKQDHVNPNLLFVGTEFGAFFSDDKGGNWTKLGGLPTIAVYDLDIQQRENDLVAATFGRGFYVLDNYTPLRTIGEDIVSKRAHLFPVKDALLYIPATPLGGGGTGSQGHNIWTAKNPSYGATFSLYLKGVEPMLKAKRQKQEKKIEKEGEAVYYPSFEEIRAEDMEEKAVLIWQVFDASGNEIRRMSSSPKKGIQRQVWNLRSNTTDPIGSKGNGFLVTPGAYSVSVVMVKDGKSDLLIDKQSFIVKGLNNQTLLAKNPDELKSFRADLAELNRKVSGTEKVMNETKDRIELIEKALLNYPNTDLALLESIRAMKVSYKDLEVSMWGDDARSSRDFETVPSISGRLGMVGYQLYQNTAGVSKTHRKNKEIGEQQYEALKVDLNKIIEDLNLVEDKLEGIIPYTKNKGENWKKD